MKLRNVFAMITAAAMTLSLAACSGQSTASSTSSASSDSSSSAASESSVSSEKSTASEESSGASYTIGICNYVDDASLNQIVENINARLAEIENEQGITINVKYDNCNADANVMNQIIANFAADNVDLMVGVATPVAMAMQSATEDSKTPVVFAAVSDPVGAGLVASLEEPGSNVTGSSDNLDTKSVMNLIFAQNPDAKKIGLLYDVGQDSSTAAIEHAKAYLDDKGVEYVERTATTAEEVALAAQALVSDGVDAVFTPTDNTIMKAEPRRPPRLSRSTTVPQRSTPKSAKSSASTSIPSPKLLPRTAREWRRSRPQRASAISSLNLNLSKAYPTP